MGRGEDPAETRRREGSLKEGDQQQGKEEHTAAGWDNNGGRVGSCGEISNNNPDC